MGNIGLGSKLAKKQGKKTVISMHTSIRRLILFATALVLVSALASGAETKSKAQREAEIQRLRAELASMQDRMAELEYRQSQEAARQSGQLSGSGRSKVAGGAVVGGALGLVGGAIGGAPVLGLVAGAAAGAGAGYLSQQYDKQKR